MERRPFSEVLKSVKVDFLQEYKRVYMLFNCRDSDGCSWRQICESNFLRMPFRGTCFLLSDFEKSFGFDFEENPNECDINMLVNYCEYVYNLTIYCQGIRMISGSVFPEPYQHILALLDKIGYTTIYDKENSVTLIVPKSQPAIRVSEMLPEDISYKVIEYNHHAMKGDLNRKQATLKILADKLEPKRNELKGINKTLEEKLFFLFNNISIRHNNTDPSLTKYYSKAVAEMTDEELEEWYDRTYDLCLHAFMTLDIQEHYNKVKELKEIIK